MKTHRVGIIGFGMIGKVHAFGYATLPYYSQPFVSTFKITHIATGHRETAQAAAQICGAEVATTDYRDVTENPEIDIVHICTPNDRHLDPLLSAIRHGKNIYCEKPLTVSREEAEEVRKALAETNYAATAQMTFHLRFFPAVQRARQLLAEGRLGRIYQFRFHYLHSSNASPRTPFKWKHSASGGVVRDLASHLLDLGDTLLGPVESLLAETQLAVSERPSAPPTFENPEPDLAPVFTEDAVTILARMKSGARGIFEASKLATGSEDELRLEIHGEAGALRFSLMNPHYLEFYNATVPDRPLGGDAGWIRIACGARFEPPETDFPSPKSTFGWIRAHAACLANFLHAVDSGQTTEPDLLQGVKIDRYLAAVLDSARSGSRVDV